MARISVVVPIYNGEHTLPILYQRLRNTVGSITGDFEIVLVEDCGADRSWEVILKLAAQDRRVKGLHFSRNFGQHHGITAGIDACDGDWVVVMDGDLQDPPEAIPALYAKAMEGYDVVVARRLHRQDGFFKRLSSRAFYALFSYLSDMRCDPSVGNFRIMSRAVVAELRGMREQLRFFVGLVEWLGFPVAAVDVEHGARIAGKSNYTLRKLLRLASGAVIAYSDKPLRMAVKLGFAISAAAFGYGAYIVWRGVTYGTAIAGWSSVIVSVYFLGGIVISILGVLGLYLGRVFDEVKKRPLYVVRDRVNV